MAENDIEALAAKIAGEVFPGVAECLFGKSYSGTTKRVLIDGLRQAALTALRSTTAEPNPAPAAWMYKRPSRLSPNHTETRLSSETWPEWFANDWTETPLFTHPTDSAAKDAEIAALHETNRQQVGRLNELGMRIVALRDAIEQALKCTPSVRFNLIVYDCGDPWEILRAALNPASKEANDG